MEAEMPIDNQIDLSPEKVIENFFDTYSIEQVKERFWFIFKSRVTSPTRDLDQLPDEETALFFDQLTDLVSAAFELHQANGARTGQREGGAHD